MQFPKAGKKSPDRLTVAVLGGGKIGEAIAKSLAENANVAQVIVTRRSPHKSNLRSKKIRVTKDNREAVKLSDSIFLAVKAADAKQVLLEISKLSNNKLIISVMAAISLKKLERALPSARLVRAMPNIAAVVGEAITAYTFGRGVEGDYVDRTLYLLGCFGEYLEIPESLMNAVTAFSGSGPAYIAVLIDAMISGALKVGIPRDVAFKLVTKTLTGTANLLSHSNIHPAELRDIVTTPAGTTIAGIYELEKGSFRTSIMNAVEAATQAAEKVAARFEDE